MGQEDPGDSPASLTVVTVEEARRRIRQLHGDLQRLVDRDPDQEVWDQAFPVLDAVLGAVRTMMPGDPVVSAVNDFLSVSSIATEDKLRAADALLIVGQVMAALPEPEIPRQVRPSWLDQRR